MVTELQQTDQWRDLMGLLMPQSDYVWVAKVTGLKFLGLFCFQILTVANLWKHYGSKRERVIAHSREVERKIRTVKFAASLGNVGSFGGERK